MQSSSSLMLGSLAFDKRFIRGIIDGGRREVDGLVQSIYVMPMDMHPSEVDLRMDEERGKFALIERINLSLWEDVTWNADQWVYVTYEGKTGLSDDTPEYVLNHLAGLAGIRGPVKIAKFDEFNWREQDDDGACASGFDKKVVTTMDYRGHVCWLTGRVAVSECASRWRMRARHIGIAAAMTASTQPNGAVPIGSDIHFMTDSDDVAAATEKVAEFYDSQVPIPLTSFNAWHNVHTVPFSSAFTSVPALPTPTMIRNNWDHYKNRHWFKCISGDFARMDIRISTPTEHVLSLLTAAA